MVIHHPDRLNRPKYSKEIYDWCGDVSDILCDSDNRRLYDSIIAAMYCPEGVMPVREMAKQATNRNYIPHGGVFNTDFSAIKDYIKSRIRMYVPYDIKYLAGRELLPPKPHAGLEFSKLYTRKG